MLAPPDVDDVVLTPAVDTIGAVPVPVPLLPVPVLLPVPLACEGYPEVVGCAVVVGVAVVLDFEALLLLLFVPADEGRCK